MDAEEKRPREEEKEREIVEDWSDAIEAEFGENVVKLAC